MPGAFGQPNPGPVDLGADIGAGYQQNASNKIAQARVKSRKDYTAGFAKKYGVTDVAKVTKGLSDTDLYDMASKLVAKRRGPVKPATAPGTTPRPAPKPKPTSKPAPKPAARPAAPKITAKTPAKPAAKPVARKRTTVRRRRRTTTSVRRTATAPKISATKLSALTRLA